MKRNLLLIVVSFLICSNSFGQSYKRDFLIALNARNLEKAEEVLNAWDFADANDPELYVSYFNFYTLKSQNAGTVANNGYDNEFSHKALDFISDGIERFPTRFDMRVAKIFMLSKLKEFDPYTSEVIKFIEYSVEIRNNWKEENFQLLDKPDDMFHGSITEFQEILYSEENEALYNKMLQISETMIKCYPKHVQNMLDMSTVYVHQKKYDKSLEILLKAKEIEPKNAILAFNLGHVYGLKGDRVSAKKYFELTVANANDQEQQLKDVAKKLLDEIK